MGVIEKYYSDHTTLLGFLAASGELSLQVVATESFKRSLILSIGSYFESEIKNIVLDFAMHRSSSCTELVALVNQKAVERQYHTLFDWDKSNIRKFLSLFGDEFKTRCKREIEQNSSLTLGERKFMELGSLRNIVAHQNYLTVPIEKTAVEIFKDYKDALPIINYLRLTLGAPIPNSESEETNIVVGA